MLVDVRGVQKLQQLFEFGLYMDSDDYCVNSSVTSSIQVLKYLGRFVSSSTILVFGLFISFSRSQVSFISFCFLYFGIYIHQMPTFILPINLLTVLVMAKIDDSISSCISIFRRLNLPLTSLLCVAILAFFIDDRGQETTKGL